MENKIENKEKKKFNKKFLAFGIVGILALSLVIAGAIYLATIPVTISVGEALVPTTTEIEFSGGDNVVGSDITRTFEVTNLANNPLPLQVTWVETSNPNGVDYTTDMPKIIPLNSGVNIVEVNFHYAEDSVIGEVTGNVLLSRGSDDVSAMHFTQKNLVTWVPQGLTKDVIYSVTGDTFSATGVPNEYTLVYYPNTGAYDDESYTGIVYEVIGSNTDLPMVDDLNGGSSSNYCTNGFNPNAKVCQGAKLWLVPSNAILNGVVDWNRANEFYFETDLITYTSN